jgi:predicted metal-dependent HD superfamily phosphohydrolase
MPERIDAVVSNIKARYWLQIEADYRICAWAELDRRYREEHRAYHSWRHIGEILDRLEVFSDSSTARNIIIAAAFWHDAVYDLQNEDGSPRTDRDNVFASAALFRRYTKLRDAEADAVEELILGTADHLHAKPERERYPGFYDDFNLFLDLDLGSLASPWDQFQANLDKIRFEYSRITEKEFCQVQIAMLTKFRNRSSRLFRREETRRKWSDNAAANLDRGIEELLDRLKKLST